MSKIFRLYKEGADTYQDWNESPAFPYTSTALGTIDDPDGASAKNEITSIPSPFARIDLIKSAFKEVCRMGLDGKTIFHKMVSDALDVGEIFFNIDKYAKKVEIITWNVDSMLQELKDSNSVGHQYLGDALEKYMLADARTYNFNQMQNIYLLNYVSGPNELNIIGATSPATLFFSTANDLSYINDIYFGQDRPFDNDYQPLYKRDFEFIKMWFLLRKVIPNFASLFPELESYLTLTYKAFNDIQKKNDLNNISITDVDKFSEIEVKVAQQADIVEVLGNPLYRKSHNAIDVSSDFVIDSSKSLTNKPLVLPVVSGGKYSQLQYTVAQWGIDNKAPFCNEEADLDKRILPNDGSIRAYLTISDFLEDTIVRVPHKLNKESFFDGNLQLDADKLSYLLPIKPLFFRYFDVKDLLEPLLDGKNLFEMETVAGGSIKVTLRIPIKGNNRIKYIEYTRIYYKDRNADIENNEGGMTEFGFTGLVMPLIKYIEPQDAYYTVACISTYSGKFDFNFYQGTTLLNTFSKECRNQDIPEESKAEVYTLSQQNFDYIQIKNKNGFNAIIVPIFKEQRNSENFEFSVDLGTSNTHIEYRHGNTSVCKAFSFDKRDTQICEMFVPSFIKGTTIQDDLEQEEQLINKDFLPEEIGNGEFKFPTRTVLSCAKHIDWTNIIYPYSLVNIPMTYEKRYGLQYNNVKYNIKWGKGDEQRVIESYIDCLMVMLRNKVLLNNGNLKHTKITWFYPISMSPKRLKNLRDVWDNSYEKYFGNDRGTNYMTESAAPILYFFKNSDTATNMVNVDIGGGTTDIAFATNANIQLVTSFKFASNSLFENPFSDNIRNGIIDWHKGDIYDLLEKKELGELKRIFNSSDNEIPSNMASFLFSLVDNSMVVEKGLDPKAIDFNRILQDDENFKIVFVLFYTSIIYHIAQIVKEKGLTPPRHITFSGNGSRIIKVISTDSRLLAKYTKVIFEKVMNITYQGELEILGLEKKSNPKEATCKGGFVQGFNSDDRDKIVVFQSHNNSFVTDDTYNSVGNDYKEKTVKSIETFFDFALNTMNAVFNFDDNFGVTTESLKIAREECKKDLMTFLDKGIALRKEESEAQNKIEETFFFYPIKGVLNAISSAIYESLTNK